MALSFLKVIWQYLWIYKPTDIFHGQNPYCIDATFFMQILAETLIKLPQMAPSVDQFFMNGHIMKIVFKSLQLLSIFVKEQEFE